MKPSIIVHNIEQAREVVRAVNETGVEIALQNAPGSHAYAGVSYVKAMMDSAISSSPHSDITQVFDAGDNAAVAVAAISRGFSGVCYRGPKAMEEKIANIAAQEGVSFNADDKILDTNEQKDVYQSCKDWLKKTT